MIKLNVIGEAGLGRALTEYTEKIQKGVDNELTASALQINADQKSATPVDTGNLRANNLVDVSQPLYKELSNPTTYAPYIEFGTGAAVEIPSELQDEAMQFKGMGVRKVNMRAQPFFFWPYFMERSKLITRIKTLLS